MASVLSDNCEEKLEKLLHGVLFQASAIKPGRAWNNVIFFLIQTTDKDCSSGFIFVVHDASAWGIHVHTAFEPQLKLRHL